MAKVKDLSGRRFGELSVIEPSGRHVFAKGGAHIYWLCQCDCGREKRINGGSLRTGRTISCGCHMQEIGRRRGHKNTRHGMTGSPEHRVWSSMRARCRNNSPYYGARGIEVCERWEVFENFLADMGPRPSASHSLGRKENDIGYCPENCRWETRVEQARNQRSNRIVTYQGKTGPLASFFEMGSADPAYDLVMQRVSRGWPIEKAMQEPPNTNLARF